MLNPIDYWRFHDDYTAMEAACLILNIEPDSGLTPYGFEAVFSGITKAINNGKLKASIRYPTSYIQDSNNLSWVQYPNIDEEEGIFEDKEGYPLKVHFKKTPDWNLTTIEVNDLKEWLLSRNFKPEFFFSETTQEPDYLDKNHPRYSPKLAAAVKAWLAMEDENLLKGKSVIPTVTAWLESRYKELSLIHKRDHEKNGYKAGDMNTGAINTVAKIVNWNEDGGATKTPN